MKLNSIRLGIASAVTTAILWIICSLLVVSLPKFTTSMTAGMMHSDTMSLNFLLTWQNFFWGLVAWVIWAGIGGWLIAFIYNLVLPN